MKRWLTVLVGVGLAAAAFHALFATPPSPRSASVSAAGSAPAHEDIDRVSRDRLERVLREAEAREAGTR